MYRTLQVLFFKYLRHYFSVIVITFLILFPNTHVHAHSVSTHTHTHNIFTPTMLIIEHFTENIKIELMI